MNYYVWLIIAVGCLQSWFNMLIRIGSWQLRRF